MERRMRLPRIRKEKWNFVFDQTTQYLTVQFWEIIFLENGQKNSENWIWFIFSNACKISRT